MGVGHNEVIQDSRIYQRQGLFQGLGQADVGVAGISSAGRVVVERRVIRYVPRRFQW